MIVRLNAQKKLARKLRWEKIAQSAAQQCQRSSIPVIEPIQEIKKFFADLRDFDLKLIPTLTSRRQSLKSILTRAQAKNILVLIGPEGDFTPEEVRLAEGAGCIPVTLGDTVLRVDTAAIAVTSFIKLYADS